MPDASSPPPITLGTSDAKMIMRGERGKLWRIKKGLEQPEDLTWKLPVQMGLATEFLNMQFYEHEWGHVVVGAKHAAARPLCTELGIPHRESGRGDNSIEILCKSDARFTAHPDGFVTINGDVGIFEMKQTDAISQWNEAERVVKHNWWQFIHLMMVADLPFTEVSVIYGNGNDMRAHRVQRDMDEEAILRASLLEFLADWDKGVEPPDTIPVASNPTIGAGGHAKWTKKYTAKQLPTLPFANEFKVRAAEFLENAAKAKTYDEAKKALKDMLPDDAVSLVADGVSITRNKKGAITVAAEKEKADASS